MQYNDQITNLETLKIMVKNFVTERDWEQFHSPKNLAAKISIEAGELLEKFVWMDSTESFQEIEKNRQEIENELGDVLILIFSFANVTNIDLTTAVIAKLVETKAKYPIEKSKGIAKKYNKL